MTTLRLNMPTLETCQRGRTVYQAVRCGDLGALGPASRTRLSDIRAGEIQLSGREGRSMTTLPAYH
jgi:hypothetical protein